MNMIDINDLRIKLYNKYSRKELSEKLKVSEITITRILNNHSPLTIDRYNTLTELLK